MPDWVVWYDDGASVTSLERLPHEVPRWGVICIAVRSPDHGRVIWHGGDYYWWDGSSWLRGDLCGLQDYLDQPGHLKIRLRGRTVSVAQFHRIFAMAVADPRLPPKSSRDHLEHEASDTAPRADEVI